jgi:hypothetical protein
MAGSLGGVALAACSLVTSLDGYTGGPTAGSPDAGPAGEAGAPDAASDGAADAGGSFCATSRPDVTFCLDFDERGLAVADLTASSNGSYVVDTTKSTSPPGSLLATVTPTATAPGWAIVGHADPRTVGDVVIEYAVLAEQSAPSDDIEIVHYELGNWTLGMGVFSNGKLYVYQHNADNSTYSTLYTGPTRAPGAWARVRLHFAIGAGKVDLDVDGTRVATGLAASPPSVTATGAELWVGVAYAAKGSQRWTVRVDDIVYDAR